MIEYFIFFVVGCVLLCYCGREEKKKHFKKRVITYETKTEAPKNERKEGIVWKSEERCRETFERLFKGHLFQSMFHPQIINPKTGFSLQLDGYNKKLNIAFEYNGRQHYKFPNFFHKTREDFDSQLMRDRFKIKRCEELGIHLIVIPYWETHIEEYIERELSKRKLIQ